MLNNKTQLNRVIGYPLEHTQSPILHNTIYNVLNCNAVMVAHPTQNLNAMIDAIKTLPVQLTAVTMPYKAAILPFLDHCSLEVQELKAANTVIYREGELFGYNTDIDGVAYALRDVSVRHKNVLILGAGGAAYAAAYYLKQNHANLLWLNRTPAHALRLQELFGGHSIDNQQLDQLSLDVIINTTPVGMFPNIECSPLPNYQFHPDQVVFDMVYNPVETLLLQSARLQGAFCISGLDMFIGQGVRQIELWLNQPVATAQLVDSLKIELEKSQKQLEEIV